MAVPNEFALDLYHLDLVVVHRGHDSRRVALVEERELLREIDRLVHEIAHATVLAPGPRALGLCGCSGVGYSLLPR
jgi:hypothetical protein